MSEVSCLNADLRDRCRFPKHAFQSGSQSVQHIARLSICRFEASVWCRVEPEAQVGVWLRAASATALDDALLARIAALLDLEGPAVLRYADPRLGQTRLIRLERATDATQVGGFLLGGDTRAAVWLQRVRRVFENRGAQRRRRIG